MAIAIDVSSLGSTYVAANATTAAFTTGSAVASGGFIVLAGGWFSDNTGTVTGISGGGLTWTVNKQPNGGTSLVNAWIASAQAPSGLASGTTITATFSATQQARFIMGMSFTGVATSSPVDGTPTGQTKGSTAAWATPSYSIAAGSVIVAACAQVGPSANNSPTSPSLEGPENDQAGDTVSFVMEYRIESSAGSYTVAGTWSSGVGIDTSNAAVAYLTAAGAVDTGEWMNRNRVDRKQPVQVSY